MQEVTERTGIMLVCKDCGNEFPFTPGEQEFFAEHDLSEPKRCPLCRRWRKFVDRQNARLRAEAQEVPDA